MLQLEQTKMLPLEAVGGNIALTIAGGPELPQTLLCIHGFQGSRASFKYLIGAQARLNVRIIAPDLPGHGASVKDGFSYTVDTFAAALTELSTKLALRNVIVLAHSIGGAIALSAAAQGPLRSKLSGFINCEGNLIASDCGLMTRRIAELTSAYALDSEFLKFQHSTPDANADGLKALAGDILRVSTPGNLLREFVTLPAPKLYVQGNRSVNPEVAELLERDGIEIATIAQCGHDMMSDQPEELLNLVKNFLAKEKV